MRRCILLAFLLAAGFGFTSLLLEGGAPPPSSSLTLTIPGETKIIDFGPYPAFSSGNMTDVWITNCQIYRNPRNRVTIYMRAGDTHLRSDAESIPVGQLAVRNQRGVYLGLTTNDQLFRTINAGGAYTVSFTIRMRMTLLGTEAATDGYPPYSVGLIVTAVM